jgi:pilus assembly protein Flp/PilA
LVKWEEYICENNHFLQVEKVATVIACVGSQDEGGVDTGSIKVATMQLIERLANDEDGAALLEYTVLLGILLVAVIAVIGSVGGWISNQWTNLNAALPGN